MRLYTPDNLLYPITVTKLLRQPGDDILVNAPLFGYEYKSTVQVWDKDKGEHVDRIGSLRATFESELEGNLTSLSVVAGQVLTRRSLVADVEEPCKHEVQFGGLCANCGKDMSEVNSYNESMARTQRATINTIHDRTELLVSEAEATRADEEAKRRLLDSKRLSLVVDLDQTIIHASVEPTIGEWQNDPSNPNHEAVKDVRKFQLVDDVPGRPGTWYYIKLRPGLLDFLQTMSKFYEMHIYTMGTRAYAQNIAKIIDPEAKIFGARILSRDESGSMTAKNLKRLFPVDTKMVVIIDDRADVWHWIPNLIKVNVYEFFVGIGDINSSFLPKRPELAAKPQAAKMERIPSNKATNTALNNSETSSDDPSNNSIASALSDMNGEGSAVEKLVSMAGNQDAESMKSKEEEQEQTITEQLESRPLLQKQKILDAMEEEEAKTSPAVEAAADLLADNGDVKEETPLETPPRGRYRHNLLQDDDTELVYLEQSLRHIHEAYFAEYDREAAGSKGSRVAELRPGHTKKRSVDEFEHIPDAAVIMDNLKTKVLEGVNLVFSGVVPLGVDVNAHDTALWAKSFGATVSVNITKRTTHIIASPERRTAKVRQAATKGPRIAIVSQNWLFACFTQWHKVNEDPYRIHTDAPTNGAGGLPDSFEGKEYNLSSSDEEAAQTEDETDGGETPNGAILTLNTNVETDTEEWEKHKPKMDREDSSPTEAEVADDWAEINAELAEFDTDDDSDATDNESTRSEELATPPSQKKRKQDDLDTDDEARGSRLSKRKRDALQRTTSLTNMTANVAKSTLPAADGDPGGIVTDDEDLEAQLAAEMEKED